MVSLCAAALGAGSAAGALAQSPVPADVVSCLVLPWDVVDLAAPGDGIVAEMAVERGDEVREGELLVRLADRLQLANLALAEARAADTSQVDLAEIRLDIAQSSYDRNLPLFERQQVTGDEWDRIRGTRDLAQVELDAAREAGELARIEVERAQASLELTRVYAPADAVVLQRGVSVGETTAGAVLLQLAVIDRLRVEVFAQARSFAAWQEGETIPVAVNLPEPAQIDARVRAVNAVSDAGTGVIGVQLELDNGDGAVLPGQPCTLAEPVNSGREG
ncbi:efflux RND transporter periplasmic adaptor subunit [Pelagibacterium montanilacus]|uniref:efflux RND transporter periplasmic adaptor subunit n=1 Tax=Pelagibacterium montanilacus TaxID=2185280 RepID=UPI0013E09F33|nr:efflux RND transporter periplasmic adaptor subunit [Pelagibacterium montanilacus]